MKIMKIVYMQECESSSWDGSNSQMYMGEESWTVGEVFKGEFVIGVVNAIVQDGDGGYTIWVTTQDNVQRPAICLLPNAVQRIYYGEE